MAGEPRERVALGTIVREWGRIGCVGFGGPPAHIALLRQLCVARRRWISDRAFEDAIAVCNLLPGPASTQLSILCAWMLRGPAGALAGGLAFILPGLVAMLALAALFFGATPPVAIRGAGAGAGAAVAAVAAQAGLGLLSPALRRREGARPPRRVAYVLAGAAAAALVGPWLVLVLLGSGVLELGIRGRRDRVSVHAWPALLAAAPAAAGLGALAWTALKVGALSYGGGFVIVPLMQADAVEHQHWMTAAQFLDAVALGQITPGPVVHTVTAVGYAAAGLGGALLAAAVAFAPSFAFVLLGARHFDRLRASPAARAFLDGAGPAAVGAILGSTVPLAGALSEVWQAAVLAGAAVLMLVLRRGVVLTLLLAGAAGALAALAGAPVPR